MKAFKVLSCSIQSPCACIHSVNVSEYSTSSGLLLKLCGSPYVINGGVKCPFSGDTLCISSDNEKVDKDLPIGMM